MKMQSTYEKLLKTPKCKRKEIRIYVGMSGGVDSSVTAYLLKKAGFNIKGIYMQCWGSDDPECRANKDRADAIKVAAFLNIPIEVWNFEKEYKDEVINYFFNEYKEGRTPNPDILCNSEIKFKLFLNKALEDGADYIATGHYVKIMNFGISNLEFTINNKLSNSKPQTAGKDLETGVSNKKSLTTNYQLLTTDNIQTHSKETINDDLIKINGYYIASGDDMWKDQSYFLSRVSPTVLNKIILPLQNIKKKDEINKLDNQTTTRSIAHSISLPVSEKPDSTGICFLDGLSPQEFLRTKFKEKQGNVINQNNEIIGKHKGAWFYTIGQRHGFEITKYSGTPKYVIEKDVKNNLLKIGNRLDLFKEEFDIQNLDFRLNNKSVQKLVNNKKIFVRIRNLGDFIKVSEINIEIDSAKLKLEKKIDAVAPGQYAVLYYFFNNEKIIIGSGVIK